MNSHLDQNESANSQHLDNENEYSQHNEELTFGEDHYEHSTTYGQGNQHSIHKNYDFW